MPYHGWPESCIHEYYDYEHFQSYGTKFNSMLVEIQVAAMDWEVDNLYTSVGCFACSYFTLLTEFVEELNVST